MPSPLQQPSTQRKIVYFGLIFALFVVNTFFWRGLDTSDGKSQFAWPTVTWWRQVTAPHFLTARVSRGRVETFVSSTGTIKPVRTVSVGAFTSGPIAEILVDCDAVEPGIVVALAIAYASEGFSQAERVVVERIADAAHSSWTRSRPRRAQPRDTACDLDANS